MLSAIDRQLQMIYLNRFIKKHVAHVKRNTKQREKYHAKKRDALMAENLINKNFIITDTFSIDDFQQPEEQIHNLTEDDFCDATPEKPRYTSTPSIYFEDDFLDQVPEKKIIFYSRDSPYSYQFQNFFLDIMEELRFVDVVPV
jgi:hypothetical protein